jgi:formylmethanofuran dehydrogenase subunit E
LRDESGEELQIRALAECAELLHGHRGPYLILGLRAGLAAVKVLGRDPFKMRALVWTGGSPPSSCFIDGVQLATGCTLGKGNIERQVAENVSALFTKDSKTISVRVRSEVLEGISRGLSSRGLEELASEIAESRTEELFEICDETSSSTTG